MAEKGSECTMVDHQSGAGGYSVSLDEFADFLKKELAPAVKHFTDDADNLRQVQQFSTAQLIGPDPEGLSAGFKSAWDAELKTLAGDQSVFRDSLRSFIQALQDVYNTYYENETDGAHRFRSIGNF